MKPLRGKLRRWHTWLGWVVGIPVLLWVVSGLFMVVRPIEEVRGEHLLREPAPIRLPYAPIPPAVGGVRLQSLELAQGVAGPRWVITLPDGTVRLADPSSGVLLPPVSAADAVREVTARYTGTATIVAATRTDPAKPPLELRRPIAAWKVAMDDGTHFYVDAGSGKIVATRTRWWRFYDLMWGIHIMDLKSREELHNPLVVGFAIASLVMSMLALALLGMTVKLGRKSTS